MIRLPTILVIIAIFAFLIGFGYAVKSVPHTTVEVHQWSCFPGVGEGCWRLKASDISWQGEDVARVEHVLESCSNYGFCLPIVLESVAATADSSIRFDNCHYVFSSYPDDNSLYQGVRVIDRDGHVLAHAEGPLMYGFMALEGGACP